jgi:hypothetical protein
MTPPYEEQPSAFDEQMNGFEISVEDLSDEFYQSSVLNGVQAFYSRPTYEDTPADVTFAVLLSVSRGQIFLGAYILLRNVLPNHPDLLALPSAVFMEFFYEWVDGTFWGEVFSE